MGAARKLIMPMLITDQTVQEILKLRKIAKFVKEQSKEADSVLDAYESELIEAIVSGKAQIATKHQVAVNETGRRIVSWKECFERHVGKEIAEQIIENTEPTIYRHLILK
jgi:hypothetical protein